MQIKTVIANEFIYYREEPNVATVNLWAHELRSFQPVEVSNAYIKLRNTHTKVPMPQFVKRQILNYVDAEEAFAMLPQSEDDAIVWNDPMSIAWGSVKELMEEDSVAARMSFKKIYEAEVLNCLANNKKAKYKFSAGFDKSRKDQVLFKAVQRGLIESEDAVHLSPEIALPSPKLLQIEGPKETFTEEIREANMKKLKEMLSAKKVSKE